MSEEPARPELSVVMPCLNEAETVPTCVRTAREALEAAGIDGEVIVADNGSSDGSPEVAAEAGARVVPVEARGYGAALMGGIAAARGRAILMGDADESYDFAEIPRFVERLRAGDQLVQGCRLPAGGGRILPGAMPALHRHVGNPLLTAMVRRMFGAPVRDAYCGLRAFTRALYDRLDLRCTGMEFATEMIVKASLQGARIAEVPVTLRPDGRRSHGPHLRTFRDGWRTVRFFLLFSPRWLFLYPGVALLAVGALGYAAVLPGLELAGLRPGAHALLVASLALLMGYQSLLFAILSKTFAVTEGLVPPDPRLDRFYRYATLEMGIAVALGGLLAGGALLARGALGEPAASGGGRAALLGVIPGVTLAALGFQTLLWSFFASLLGMGRR